MNNIGRNIYQIQDARSKNIDKKQRPSFKLYDETKGNKSVYERNAIKSDYCDSILNQTFFWGYYHFDT